MLEDLSMTTKTLDVIHLNVSHKIPSECLMDISAYVDYISDSLVIRLDAYLAAERAQEIRSDVVAMVPATWFDHLRHSCFPNLLTGRFPIKYKDILHTYDVTHYHVIDNISVTPEAARRGKIDVYEYK